MSVHTCQCRCVPHVEDHCRNGEPDFPPEVIEKAARALYEADITARFGYVVHEWESNINHEHYRSRARAVLAAVADDLIAKGAEGDQHWMKQEYDRSRERNALIPPHARMVVTNPELSAHSRNTAPVKADAYQRGMVAGARQAGDAIEAAIETLPTVVSTVGPDGWPAADHTAYRLYLDALRLLPQVARDAACIEKGGE